jgi:patatin-like phospholipase/acyl hydrolase
MRSKNTANTCNTIAWLLTGTVIGSLTALLIWEKKKNHDIKLKRQQQQQQQRKIRSSTTTKNNHQHCCDCINKEKRERLPELAILLRHGESEYNADNTLWRTKPDNIINLTEKGIQQAKEAGLRIENLFQSYGNNGRNNKIDININRVQMYVSPFERTLQTTWAARPFFKHRVVETLLESRIREQVGGI